jgi:hypothetical protein
MLEGKGPAPGGGGGGGGVAVDMNELVKMKEQMNTEAERAEAGRGLSRIVALHHRSSTLYQTH